ncbi:MAG: hypothetical protein OXB90_01520 [Acidimicrobiaceae bacterium]|nr:hypothetical protein [Acidimicrobiaceae bacterium]
MISGRSRPWIGGSSEISGYWVYGEMEGLVAGTRRVVAAMNALQTRCATEIEALDDGGRRGSKVALVEVGRMSTRAANRVAKTVAGRVYNSPFTALATRAANRVAKTVAGFVEMPKLAELLAEGKITAEHAAD